MIVVLLMVIEARALSSMEQIPASTDMDTMNAVSQQSGFYRDDDGYLCCDQLRVDDIRSQVPESPFYLYSKAELTSNINSYTEALEVMFRCSDHGPSF